MRLSSFELVIETRCSEELGAAIRWWRLTTGRPLVGVTLRREGAALRLGCEPSAQQLDAWYAQAPRLFAKALKARAATKSQRATATRQPAFA